MDASTEGAYNTLQAQKYCRHLGYILVKIWSSQALHRQCIV